MENAVVSFFSKNRAKGVVLFSFSQELIIYAPLNSFL